MKTRILFFLVLTAALSWVGYALWLTKNQQKVLSPEVFFTGEQPIWFINRADYCATIPKEWQLNDLVLADYLKGEDAFIFWKSVAVQYDEQSGITRFLFEEKTGLSTAQFTEFLSRAGLQFFATKESVQGNWHLLHANGYLAASNAPIVLDKKADDRLSALLVNRDAQASYSIIHSLQSEDVYCFPVENRHYIASLEHGELFKTAAEADDAELFTVIPDVLRDFCFVERQMLQSAGSNWNDSPLLPYIDRGVVWAGDERESILFVDLAAQYTPKEMLEQWSNEGNPGQANIYRLKVAVNGWDQPFATGLENVLVVANSKETLERIRLSYQMGKGWSSNPKFAAMRKDQPARVSMRWFGLSQVPENLLEIIPYKGANGNLLLRKGSKELLWTLYQKSTDSLSNMDNPEVSDAELVWNFSLENKNSRFFIGSETVCVYNPDKGTISQVNTSGKVGQWIQVDEPIKTIHSLEGGYLIELFNKLMWFPENPNEEKVKEIPFKGAIVSNIARYIWKGHPSIGFVSENFLYRISLKSGEVQRDKMAQNVELSSAQLHAFNFEGDLTFGLLHADKFHLFNTKRNNWRTVDLDGEVLWSEKLNGKIHYLTRKESNYQYHIFKESVRKFSESMSYLTHTLSGTQPVFIFGSDGQIRLVPEGVPSGEMYSLQTRKPEMTAVVLKGLKPRYILVLNGILNEIEIFDVENERKISKNGSQFLKFVSPNKVITFVDGQLVMYKF